MKFEFSFPPYGIEENFERTLSQMINQGLLTFNKYSETANNVNGGQITIVNDEKSKSMYGFLCSLFWPFIDSYWTASLVLVGLRPSLVIEQSALLSRMQSLAETLFHEGIYLYITMIIIIIKNKKTKYRTTLLL